MKQLRSFGIRTGVLALMLLVMGAGQASALTLTSTQEIKVTAVVPGHRDIVVNTRGEILSISSNTLEDLVPTVYLGDLAPENKHSLSPELYKKYRSYVPEGTARYGMLYEAKFPAQLTVVNPPWSKDRG